MMGNERIMSIMRWLVSNREAKGGEKDEQKSYLDFE